MNTAKLKELRQKEDKELRLDISGLQKELFDLRFQSSTEKLANPSRISQIRKELARLKTLLRERELAAVAAGADSELTNAGTSQS